MKIAVRLQCGVCGVFFLVKEGNKAKKHERACKTAKEILEKGLVIKSRDNGLDKNVVLGWIKGQGCGHEDWVERSYSSSPDGAHLYAALWKGKIVGVLIFEHAYLPLEQDYYNGLVGVFTAKEEGDPVQRAVDNNLRCLYEEQKLED